MKISLKRVSSRTLLKLVVVHEFISCPSYTQPPRARARLEACHLMNGRSELPPRLHADVIRGGMKADEAAVFGATKGLISFGAAFSARGCTWTSTRGLSMINHLARVVHGNGDRETTS